MTTRGRRTLLHLVLASLAVAWLFPIAWAIYVSFRPYADTAARGYVSLPGSLSLENYRQAWDVADLSHAFLNTALIVAPAVVLVLGISVFLGFALSRYSWRFNLAVLLLLTAGNLLPPQVLITPLFRLYLALPLPAPLSDNGTFLRPGHRADRDPRRDPDRLLHVRPEQLHEDPLARPDRGLAHRRRHGHAAAPPDRSCRCPAPRWQRCRSS